MKVQITTDRLPSRPKGSVHDVTPEKAASLVAQGFAVALEEEAAPQAPRRRRGEK